MFTNGAWKHPRLFGRAWARPLAWWAEGRVRQAGHHRELPGWVLSTLCVAQAQE